jgi:hypothetical protein
MEKNLEEHIEHLFGKNLHKFEFREFNCDYYINNEFEPIIEVNNYTGKVAYRNGIFQTLHNYNKFDKEDIDVSIKKYLLNNYNINTDKIDINFDWSIRQVKQKFFDTLGL